MQVLALAMLLILVVRLAGPLLHGNSMAVVGLAGLMSVSALAYGLLVAPLFALWSRSTLAATVFTVALPLVTCGVDLVAALYGVENLSRSWPAGGGCHVLVAMLAQCCWDQCRLPRLPAAGHRFADLAIRPPRFVVRAKASGASATSGTRRRRALVVLVWKELRLLTPATLPLYLPC
jgi:hypothetical protein